MLDLPPNRATYLNLAEELELNLREHVLSKWFPQAVDPRGGFLQDFDRSWNPAETQSAPSVVYCSRLTFTASLAALYGHPGMDSIARHGLGALSGSFWDVGQGGFWWHLGNSDKHVYGVAFAIYASATFYRAFGETEALKLAQRGFDWLEQHAHDAAHGGYFEVLDASGSVVVPAQLHPVTGDAAKSMNTHIHLLEAFAALHSAAPSPLLRTRLNELVKLVVERIFNGKSLTMFFDADWTPRGQEDSYGHDIETAYLLLEAIESLGEESTQVSEVARRLVDHTLDVAWDYEQGGIADRGTVKEPENRSKVWWAQAEALNALLLMHQLHGESEPRYWAQFVAEWRFIQSRQIDPVYGGWFAELHPDGTPRDFPKSGPWTDPYHQGRALMTAAAKLRNLAGHGLIS